MSDTNLPGARINPGTLLLRCLTPICFLFALSPFTLDCSPAFSEETSAYSLALAAYHDRRLEEALAWAKEAVAKEPEHTDAHVLLGELYYLKQELGKAQESWERALKLAPSRPDVRERLNRLKKESVLENSLARSDTYPFVVRFSREEGTVDVGGLRQLLRDTHRQVGQQFQYFPDHAITVILYPESDFEQVKGVSHQIGGLYDGKIRLPLNPDDIMGDQLQRVLWHEYTHAVVHDLSKGICPLWLNEGIATLQEARVRAPDLDSVREALQGNQLVGWDELWNLQQYDEARLRLHYVESYLIVQYLVKRWGWNGLVGLLKRLGQGTPIADAIRAQYKMDPKDLEKEWLNWIRRNV